MNATPMHSRLRAWPGLLLILAVLLGASWAPQPASAAPSPSSLEFNADAGGIDRPASTAYWLAPTPQTTT